jgi:hypothetical protein|tara:strand:+ start:233 stop:430 length:198 start_codon:yes stop_codon:yes gene_type:complete
MAIKSWREAMQEELAYAEEFVDLNTTFESVADYNKAVVLLALQRVNSTYELTTFDIIMGIHDGES